MISLPRCRFQTRIRMLNIVSKTDMRKEIEEIPLAIERLLSAPENKIQKAADALRDLNPKLIATFAGQGLQS